MVKKLSLSLLFAFIPLFTLTSQAGEVEPPAPQQQQAGAAETPEPQQNEQQQNEPSVFEQAETPAPAPQEAQNEGLPQVPQSYSGVVPEAVRRPDQLLVPVYPKDLSIGELGPGEASMETYTYARKVLADVLQAKADSPLLASLKEDVRTDLFEKTALITPRKYRVGGGKEQIDGSVSFLFRFLGRELELAGAIYLQADENGAWAVEDIISEDSRSIDEARESESPDSWNPYDRMY